jgi:hypothetical protein
MKNEIDKFLHRSVESLTHDTAALMKKVVSTPPNQYAKHNKSCKYHLKCSHCSVIGHVIEK